MSMIYGVGIDIVDVSRIERALERWGDRFLRRIFTSSEMEYCRGKAKPASRFALRFAAKEAFLKALGLGLREGLSFHHIEVVNTLRGRPSLNLHGRAKELCQARGVKKCFLSLSDDGLNAIAMVVLER